MPCHLHIHCCKTFFFWSVQLNWLFIITNTPCKKKMRDRPKSRPTDHKAHLQTVYVQMRRLVRAVLSVHTLFAKPFLFWSVELKGLIIITKTPCKNCAIRRKVDRPTIRTLQTVYVQTRRLCTFTVCNFFSGLWG